MSSSPLDRCFAITPAEARAIAPTLPAVPRPSAFAFVLDQGCAGLTITVAPPTRRPPLLALPADRPALVLLDDAAGLGPAGYHRPTLRRALMEAYVVAALFGGPPGNAILGMAADGVRGTGPAGRRHRRRATRRARVARAAPALRARREPPDHWPEGYRPGRCLKVQAAIRPAGSAPGIPATRRAKPPGRRNHATRAAEALLDGEAERLTRKALELALAGDGMALRLCLERLLPPRKARPVVFELPPLATAADAARAAGALAAAVAAGELTPGEAAELAKVIDAHLRALEATEFERRLAELERRAGGR